MKAVSFGSFYKVYQVASDVHNQKTGHLALNDYCKKNQLFTKLSTYPEPLDARFLGKGEKILQTRLISALDEYDNGIDMICCNHRLKYEKITPTESVLRTWNNKQSGYKPLRTIFGAWH